MCNLNIVSYKVCTREKVEWKNQTTFYLANQITQFMFDYVLKLEN